MNPRTGWRRRSASHAVLRVHSVALAVGGPPPKPAGRSSIPHRAGQRRDKQANDVDGQHAVFADNQRPRQYRRRRSTQGSKGSASCPDIPIGAGLLTLAPVALAGSFSPHPDSAPIGLDRRCRRRLSQRAESVLGRPSAFGRCPADCCRDHAAAGQPSGIRTPGIFFPFDTTRKCSSVECLQ
jgi:hypothetical protein